MESQIIMLLATTLITSVFWVGFEVYHALTQTPAPIVSENYLKELNPDLNTGILDEVEKKTP